MIHYPYTVVCCLLLFPCCHFWSTEPRTVVVYTWNRAIITAVFLHALGPLFDLILLNWRSLEKSHFWRFFFQENAVNLLRLLFLAAVSTVIAREGMLSPLLRWDGTGLMLRRATFNGAENRR